VASRLTEDPSVTVAVIEAGPNAEEFPEVRTLRIRSTGRADIISGVYSWFNRHRPIVHHSQLGIPYGASSWPELAISHC
jgi:choline dehydrogenase-like flavoprotein